MSATYQWTECHGIRVLVRDGRIHAYVYPRPSGDHGVVWSNVPEDSDSDLFRYVENPVQAARDAAAEVTRVGGDVRSGTVAQSEGLAREDAPLQVGDRVVAPARQVN